MEKVNNYLKNLKFKKSVVGGCDEEGVLKAIENICSLYEEELKAEKSKSEETKRKLIDELNTTVANNEKICRECEALRRELRRRETQADHSQQDSEKVMSVLSSVSELREEITKKAKQDAMRQRAKAEQEISLMKKQSLKDIENMRHELIILAEKKKKIISDFHLISSFCRNVEKMVQTLNSSAGIENTQRRSNQDIGVHATLDNAHKLFDV